MHPVLRRSALAASCLFLLQCSGATTELRHPSGTKILDASGYLYDPSDKSCDGFPRLEVQTMPGTCLGLVLSQKAAISPLRARKSHLPRARGQLSKSGAVR